MWGKWGVSMIWWGVLGVRIYMKKLEIQKNLLKITFQQNFEFWLEE